MENERLLSEQEISIRWQHFFEVTPAMSWDETIAIAQDAKSIAARDKWWVTEIDKHLKQFQGYEYIDNEWWQSLKQSLDTNWCDPTCELYDGRMCDVAEHCNRRQAWKKSLEVKE